MGHNKQFLGPNTNQKKHFGYDYPNIATITTAKSFNNPNFVNKHHPRVHNFPRTDFTVSPSPPCQSDSQDSTKSLVSESPFINSSQSIIESLKENNLEIIQPVDSVNVNVDTNIEVNTISKIASKDKPPMSNKRLRKTRHKSRRGQDHCKNPLKTVKNVRQEINELMDIDMEPQNYSNMSDVSMSPKEPHILTLSDFLSPQDSFEKYTIDVSSEHLIETDEEDGESDIMSRSPHTGSTRLKRDRTISVAESEDSFIVFESGTDDELEFSDNSQEDDETDDCYDDTDDDELDSSPSVVPTKKVIIISHLIILCLNIIYSEIVFYQVLIK